MNNTNKKSSTMTYLIVILVIGLAFLVYFYVNGNKTGDSLTLEEISDSDQVVGARVLTLLNEISSLNIDASFFKNQLYSTLRDYTVEIPALPIGRANPFSAVAGMSSVASPSR